MEMAEQTERAERCANCAYCIVKRVGRVGMSRNIYECHRHAPMPLAGSLRLSIDKIRVFSFYWPGVVEESWCGEYLPADWFREEAEKLEAKE